MSTQIREQAEEVAKLVDELNAVVLLEPSADLVPLPEADAPTAEQIARRMGEIDMTDTNSIVTFGSAAQAELQQISQAMLDGVKNKDVGPAGDSLREIVGTIRGFSVDELDPNRKQSWWERSSAAPSRCMISSPSSRRCRTRSTGSPTTFWATSTR
jgi:uncharacterized protein YaaN involved in tellurite resistance